MDYPRHHNTPIELGPGVDGSLEKRAGPGIKRRRSITNAGELEPATTTSPTPTTTGPRAAAAAAAAAAATPGASRRASTRPEEHCPVLHHPQPVLATVWPQSAKRPEWGAAVAAVAAKAHHYAGSGAGTATSGHADEDLISISARTYAGPAGGSMGASAPTTASAESRASPREPGPLGQLGGQLFLSPSMTDLFSSPTPMRSFQTHLGGDEPTQAASGFQRVLKRAYAIDVEGGGVAAAPPPHEGPPQLAAPLAAASSTPRLVLADHPLCPAGGGGCPSLQDELDFTSFLGAGGRRPEQAAAGGSERHFPSFNPPNTTSTGTLRFIGGAAYLAQEGGPCIVSAGARGPPTGTAATPSPASDTRTHLVATVNRASGELDAWVQSSVFFLSATGVVHTPHRAALDGHNGAAFDPPPAPSATSDSVVLMAAHLRLSSAVGSSTSGHDAPTSGSASLPLGGCGAPGTDSEAQVLSNVAASPPALPTRLDMPPMLPLSLAAFMPTAQRMCVPAAVTTTRGTLALGGWSTSTSAAPSPQRQSGAPQLSPFLVPAQHCSAALNTRSIAALAQSLQPQQGLSPSHPSASDPYSQQLQRWEGGGLVDAGVPPISLAPAFLDFSAVARRSQSSGAPTTRGEGTRGAGAAAVISGRSSATAASWGHTGAAAARGGAPAGGSGGGSGDTKLLLSEALAHLLLPALQQHATPAAPAAQSSQHYSHGSSTVTGPGSHGGSAASASSGAGVQASIAAPAPTAARAVPAASADAASAVLQPYRRRMKSTKPVARPGYHGAPPPHLRLLGLGAGSGDDAASSLAASAGARGPSLLAAVEGALISHSGPGAAAAFSGHGVAPSLAGAPDDAGPGQAKQQQYRGGNRSGAVWSSSGPAVGGEAPAHNGEAPFSPPASSRSTAPGSTVAAQLRAALDGLLKREAAMAAAAALAAAAAAVANSAPGDADDENVDFDGVQLQQHAASRDTLDARGSLPPAAGSQGHMGTGAAPPQRPKSSRPSAAAARGGRGRGRGKTRGRPSKATLLLRAQAVEARDQQARRIANSGIRGGRSLGAASSGAGWEGGALLGAGMMPAFASGALRPDAHEHGERGAGHVGQLEELSQQRMRASATGSVSSLILSACLEAANGGGGGGARPAAAPHAAAVSSSASAASSASHASPSMEEGIHPKPPVQKRGRGRPRGRKVWVHRDPVGVPEAPPPLPSNLLSTTNPAARGGLPALPDFARRVAAEGRGRGAATAGAHRGSGSSARGGAAALGGLTAAHRSLSGGGSVWPPTCAAGVSSSAWGPVSRCVPAVLFDDEDGWEEREGVQLAVMTVSASSATLTHSSLAEADGAAEGDILGSIPLLNDELMCLLSKSNGAGVMRTLGPVASKLTGSSAAVSAATAAVPFQLHSGGGDSLSSGGALAAGPMQLLSSSGSHGGGFELLSGGCHSTGWGSDGPWSAGGWGGTAAGIVGAAGDDAGAAGGVAVLISSGAVGASGAGGEGSALLGVAEGGFCGGTTTQAPSDGRAVILHGSSISGQWAVLASEAASASTHSEGGAAGAAPRSLGSGGSASASSSATPRSPAMSVVGAAPAQAHPPASMHTRAPTAPALMGDAGPPRRY